MIQKLSSLEAKIGIKFKSSSLLQNAFIHRSYLNEHKDSKLPSNERLEFLGDSVLSLITSVYLFRNFPYLMEGDYTEIKSAIVKTDSLATSAKILELNEYLLLSKGETKSGGKTNRNILADCFEALIGAIFLDSSFEKAYQFVGQFLFKDRLNKLVKSKEYLSPKSRLQELIQAKYKTTPLYKVETETGPEHKRIFKIGVYFRGKKLGVGVAPSKKEAEEEAAKKAFENLRDL
ncbi:MAG: Ribonuclease 3 [Candidatus Roizmanbacteria bacterium GW2011_GWC2_37_13]|uniref:Ribonuclease 3 n=1 Tax=Candidatus Roizmanbacteria bacterium GW2011_GWC2_37_13 TaxID=1618486 RepID=A0A0G0JC01_9BACT|nr:MAG: Ribonuclease 3 [Candidatus Roizmanbacteria bacterium GW2011_GWC1_37_12]KKQ25691.1 MAG: Ribonuclease 3 [Candidatus Roizmanbacteria bacterium GW2011_GWC2_37_13]